MLTVQIHAVENGEVREHHDENHEAVGYMWSEGNYSCDCNRHLFFFAAKDLDGWDPYPPCGDTRYRVEVRDDDTGEIIYSEVRNGA